MIGLKNENVELGDSTYDYILAIQTEMSLYVCFSIKNELVHDVKVDFFKVPLSIRKRRFFSFTSGGSLH
jgi:hypothetical protein